MIKIIEADLTDMSHQIAICHLINSYLLDPMGGQSSAHSEEKQKRLINWLTEAGNVLCLLAYIDHSPAGLAVCFKQFSTFLVKPVINIHDLIVDKEYRNRGIGRALLKEIADFARKNDYGKVTLEVRKDNAVAKKLYTGMGFNECDPEMHFWVKHI